MMAGVKALLPRGLKRLIKRWLANIRDSLRYRCSVGQLRTGQVSHVVFVCKGNICRSAFAEYYLKRQVPPGTLTVESCGLDVDQGHSSPPEAIKVAGEYRLDLRHHRSRPVQACRIDRADLILAMEYIHYKRLKTMFPNLSSKIRLLNDFSPWPEQLFCNIADPYGAGENDFRRCFRQVQRAVDGLTSRTFSRES